MESYQLDCRPTDLFFSNFQDIIYQNHFFRLNSHCKDYYPNDFTESILLAIFTKYHLVSHAFIQLYQKQTVKHVNVF